MIVDGKNVTHEDLCKKVPFCQHCFDTSILVYYSEPCGDQTTIDANISKVNDNNIFSKLNTALNTPIAKQVDVATILGGLSRDSNNQINKGSALIGFLLHEVSENFNKTFHEEWEQGFLDYVRSLDVSKLNKSICICL